ncbi:SEC-C metal-binding domain-containing protein [Paenibacillus radicis (ex Gao et al. 2016)]|uniref:SEC-C domain-containing protein n=1 Tax=Paenibacillus radicis (ex Gao et al. 2016) TaxID=1737354 RepID=A0A917HLW0_9BACL|nr:SEC-C metal-binding domain-containing protein [Paenibacillus radicis (ex Gao et al. 2016)]GGG82640.1 hypothetical protein GCM10010918_45110 [Paenibacillus radicis (ex Gao et al. 2016)]
MSKLGRNEPCHCGSGIKYKKCCMAKDEQTARDNRQQAAAANGTRSVQQSDLAGFINSQLTWSNPQYAELALQLSENMQADYTPDQTVMTVMVWHTYSTATSPSFRKMGVFCAALEFMASEVHGMNKNRNELAEKYEVSAATVQKRFQEISAFMMEQAEQTQSA